MCGRYYIEPEDDSELIRTLEQYPGVTVPRGEIFPTQSIPVFIPGGACMMQWGFTLSNGKNIINARSETLLDKTLFSEHISSERVIIPCSGFFEWQRTENSSIKHAIFHPDGTMLMAGIHRRFRDQQQVVIITKAAQGEMRRIHDRMPLLFSKQEARQWIARRTDRDRICALLEANSPEFIVKSLN